MNSFNASRTGIVIPPRVVQRSSVHTHTHTHTPTGFLGSAIKMHLQCRRHRRCRLALWVRKVLWRGAWQPTSVFLPGKSHGLSSLMGYGPWGHEGLGRAEMTGHICMCARTHTHTHTHCMHVVVVVKSLGCVWLFAAPWNVDLRAPLSMGFSRQEGWSQLPFPFIYMYIYIFFFKYYICNV